LRRLLFGYGLCDSGMPTVVLIDRERSLERGRPRPNAAGNFIVLRIFSMWYSLTYGRHALHYVKFWPYRHPYPHPYGYVFNPPPEPPLVPLAPVSNPEAVNTISDLPDVVAPVVPGLPEIPSIPYFPSLPSIPTPTVPTIPPITPPTIPSIPTPTPPSEFPKPPGSTPTVPLSAPDFVGMKFTVDPGIFVQVEPLSTPIRSMVIINDVNNSSRIVIRSLRKGKDGGMLNPGEGLRLDIDDASKVLVAAESASSLVYVFYELAVA
jgi:hypothetical protein